MRLTAVTIVAVPKMSARAHQANEIREARRKAVAKERAVAAVIFQGSWTVDVRCVRRVMGFGSSSVKVAAG